MANTLLPSIGEFDFAHKLAKESIIESPYDPGSWAGKGMAEYFMGDYSIARETFENGIIRFSDGNLINTAARMYFGMGDYKRIIEIMEQYLGDNLNMRPARSLGYLAAAYYKQEDIEPFNELLSELKQQAETSPLGSPSFHLSFIYA